VDRIGRPLTRHFGPEHMPLNIDVQSRDEPSADEIGAAVDRLEESIRPEHPPFCQIFIEPDEITTARATRPTLPPKPDHNVAVPR
jgi:hypothetical protein